MSWSNTYDISWDMTKPSNEAYISGKDYEPDKDLTHEAMKKKVPIKRGDEITLLC